MKHEPRWKAVFPAIERELEAESYEIAPIIERLIGCFCGPFVNSDTRAELFFQMPGQWQPEIFWPVFHKVWDTCDDTWWLAEDLLELLRGFDIEGPRYLEPDARKFFDALPDDLTVFRGCSRERVSGLSWTLDRAVAARFARGHRGLVVPDAVIAQAVINKTWVFSVQIDREEAEIVLDPMGLREVAIEPPAG